MRILEGTPSKAIARGLSSVALLRSALLNRPRDVDLASRGFQGGTQASRRRLNEAARTFMHGYREGLACARPHCLAGRLDKLERSLQGFAYEGAAMALALLDRLSLPGGTRIRRFLQASACRHVYMVHVGIGWALARIPWRVERQALALDPFLGWLALDGYGFHQGFFQTSRYIAGKRRPIGLSPAALRVFDQGLGRSLWFVGIADPAKVSDTVAGFPRPRRSDLWSGVGLACAYVGAGGPGALTAVREAASSSGALSHLRQGVAFAAAARDRAGNPTHHTEEASRIVCGRSSRELARLCFRLAEGPRPQPQETNYEAWRRRIREALDGPQNHRKDG